MIDQLRPAGALLAALAAWSVGLLLLALAGLGARFAPHPDDPAVAPPMPRVELAEVGSRLGPASDYAEVGNRPLLNADRRPAAVAAAGDSEAPLDWVLSGVLLAGDFKAAMLQSPDGSRSQRVRAGELVEGTAWRLVALEPRRASFEGPQGRRELDLRVFDGSGEAKPSAVPASAPRATAGPATTPAAPAAAPAPAAPAAEGELSQEQQVEAIRRRIEARRAQMREDAARRNGQKVE
ncbi:hypothetical protein K3217_14025 [bacterium BD-1]|uniref:hypothetical protein n=1 Tax=Arenimonas sp. TaxID=1872635 RepID=UPI001E583391|nr:hypothetical protein [Ottowia caeni]